MQMINEDSNDSDFDPMVEHEKLQELRRINVLAHDREATYREHQVPLYRTDVEPESEAESSSNGSEDLQRRTEYFAAAALVYGENDIPEHVDRRTSRVNWSPYDPRMEGFIFPSDVLEYEY